MVLKLFGLIVMGLLLTPITGFSADDAEVLKRLEEKVGPLLPGYEKGDIRPTPITGMYELLTKGKIAYISADGEYLINGEIQRISDGKNLTEPRLAKIRATALAEIDPTTMISFPAKNERVAISVFTDVDCGYCRKLHDNIDKYNEIGVSINYMAFPRAGIPSGSYDKLAGVWCADDKNDAMTRAKRGEKIVANAECEHPIKKHYALGKYIRIRGTPAMVLDDGYILPGYIEPKKLARFLDAQE